MKSTASRNKCASFFHATHLGSQTSLSFLVWIAFSILVHFTLTCALCHRPTQETAAQFVMEAGKDSMSLDAAFIPPSKIITHTANPTSSPPENIVQSIAEDAPPDLSAESSPAIDDRPCENTPVFLSTELLELPSKEVLEEDTQKVELLALDKAALIKSPPSQWNNPELTQSNPKELLTSAQIRKNPHPRYPAQARSLGQEGTVKIRINIDPQGQVKTNEILTSSGYPLLDEAACQTILKKWRFTPAMKNGQPTQGQLTISITFELNQP